MSAGIFPTCHVSYYIMETVQKKIEIECSVYSTNDAGCKCCYTL